MAFVQWNVWRAWDLSVPEKCANYFKYSIIEGGQLCLVLTMLGKVELKWYVWVLDLIS
jgi:hypothetical protein